MCSLGFDSIYITSLNKLALWKWKQKGILFSKEVVHFTARLARPWPWILEQLRLTVKSVPDFFLIRKRELTCRCSVFLSKQVTHKSQMLTLFTLLYNHYKIFTPLCFTFFCQSVVVQWKNNNTKKEPNQISFKCGCAHLLPITPPEVVRLIELPVRICKGTLSERRLPFSFFTILKKKEKSICVCVCVWVRRGSYFFLLLFLDFCYLEMYGVPNGVSLRR